MARVTEPVKGTHSGVRISGRRMRADGSADTDALRITPERGALVNGVLYSKAAIEVTPDAEGRFEVTLPPSSALGPYTVQVDGGPPLRLVVPDGVTQATFERCVVDG